MQSVELTAKTVDEATKAAADKLGVTADKVKVTVLEETKGLFGKSTVRVRAELADGAAEPAKPAAKGRSKKQPEAVAAIQESFEEPAAAKPERKTARGRSKKVEEPEAVVEPEVLEVPESEEAEVLATEDDAKKLTDLVREVISSADLQVTANSDSFSGRYVNVRLDGKDVAFLVGKHGEVLNAMQYLINIMAGRRFANGVRVTLDGNDFRRRREDQLTKLAHNIADQVKKRGEEAVLDALPAFERRIVHKALSEYGGIQTYSEGEEPNRRVVIAPAE